MSHPKSQGQSFAARNRQTVSALCLVPDGVFQKHNFLKLTTTGLHRATPNPEPLRLPKGLLTSHLPGQVSPPLLFAWLWTRLPDPRPQENTPYSDSQLPAFGACCVEVGILGCILGLSIPPLLRSVTSSSMAHSCSPLLFASCFPWLRLLPSLLFTDQSLLPLSILTLLR